MLKQIPENITAPKGFKAAGVKAGIKKSGREDLAIIYSTVPASAAAVFTTNKMAAAPVIVSRQAMAKGNKISAIVVNSGCANACTGEQGLADAKAMVSKTAQLLNIGEDEVLVASTGIIGVNLPMDKVLKGIEKAAGNLSIDGSPSARNAIMTTDTFPKSVAVEFKLSDTVIKMAGMCKGSGMIHPNMATMLGFITTDAAITAPLLQKALSAAVEQTFNMITVDGDTSTNDMVAVMANGLAENPLIDDENSVDFHNFSLALKAVCEVMAKQIARDGEGATKFLEINVRGALSFDDAKKAAMAVAKSPLVKTAFFGEDPNWGRIVSAVGYSEAEIVPEKISLYIGDAKVVEGGMGCEVDIQQVRQEMAAHDIVVTIDLGIGSAEATVWTCDFSYEYVKINGEYHT